MDKAIRIGVYRILRKLGVKRNDISIDARLNKIIEFDAQEWTIFLFLLESRFDIFIDNQYEKRLITVEDTIETVRHILNQSMRIGARIMQPALISA